MIKINKQLQRPDKGTLSSGSLIYFSTQFNGEKKVVRFNLTHWFNQLAKDNHEIDGWKPVEEVTDFKYMLIKECTNEEWDALDGSGSTLMVKGWIKELIDSKIGDGYTEII
jgi:hypothetical protein